MEFIDTHSHKYMSQFGSDPSEYILRAQKAGVSHICIPNVDAESASGVIALAERYPGYCMPMMGLHPTHVKDDFEAQLAVISSMLDKQQFIAVGEIGMDLYWDKTFIEQQKQAFLYQLQLAEQHKLPVNIHIREAFDETFEVLDAFGKGRICGILHCFSGNVEQAQRTIDFGFLLGVGGVVTYKKAQLADVVAAISIEHLVLETDAPFLAPTPFRGKLNESSYIPHIAEKIAQLQGIAIEEVARITTANAKKVFNIA